MSPRTRLSLDGQWSFSPEKILSTDNSSLIVVPAPWQADARFRDHVGEAWYQREFELPPEWLEQERAIILGFGAVDYYAEVWVNDVKVGNHEGGYLPFEFDITKDVRAGTNTLTVHVQDPLEIFHEVPHGKQSWYGLLSGIWQSVWIESRAENYIRRVRINTDGGQVKVDLSILDELILELSAEIIAPNGEVVTEIYTRTLHLSLNVEQPVLWSPEEPNLYTLRVRLYGVRYDPDRNQEGNRDVLAATEVVDEVTETFGFRTIETQDGKILLNGRPFYMRSALDQDYYPELISTPPLQEFIEDQFRKAKEMGLNCLRIHIKVADPRYYAAADKVGLLIWTELPNHILLSEEAKRRARETLAGIVERDGNHPSICIWTIINESWGIDLTDASQRAWLAETYAWLKALDPTRLVVGNSACWGNFHVATDIADFHVYYAMPDHQRQWREWTETYAGRPDWLFAHEYKDHAAWREFARDPWRDVEYVSAPEAQPRGDEPLLVSEFGNWGLPDVDKLYEANGGAAPWWFDTGLEWGDGVVYPRGVEGRFKSYHLNEVFPSFSALSEASQRLQFDALKFEIENIRAHQEIQGYVITEFTDVHWECNGLLDMYRNPKIYHERLKKINADDVLIPVWERLVFSPGETSDIKILFSQYSTVALQQAVLEWEVTDDQLQISSGSLPIGHSPVAGVTELGWVRMAAPQVDRPACIRVQLRLTSDERVIASADHTFYVFPPMSTTINGSHVYAPELQDALQHADVIFVDSLSEADIAVVSILDDPCREFLLRGGRVLLLAETEDALQTHIPGLGIQPRAGTPWQGDWASSFGWHRFDGIPTEHVVNFAFSDLTPEHVIHGFAPRDFALDVYAGLFVGWLQKPVPTIARKRVGRGKVLVSTFRLSKNLDTNPLARYLFSELVRWIGSDKD